MPSLSKSPLKIHLTKIEVHSFSHFIKDAALDASQNNPSTVHTTHVFPSHITQLITEKYCPLYMAKNTLTK